MIERSGVDPVVAALLSPLVPLQSCRVPNARGWYGERAKYYTDTITTSDLASVLSYATV